MGRLFPSWMFPRLIIVIDLVGVVSLGCAIVGEFFPDLIDGAEGPRSEFMFNAGIELFGAWVSVRFLDLLLRMRDEHRSKRIGLLRNLRWFLSVSRGFRTYVSAEDVLHYRRECNWAREIFTRRRKYLGEDEVSDVEAAYRLIEAILDDADEVITGQEAVKREHEELHRLLPWHHEEAAVQHAAEQLRHGTDQLRDQLRGRSFDKEMVLGGIHELEVALAASRLPPETKQVAAHHFATLRTLCECTERLHRNLTSFEEAVSAAERNIREETPED